MTACTTTYRHRPRPRQAPRPFKPPNERLEAAFAWTFRRWAERTYGERLAEIGDRWADDADKARQQAEAQANDARPGDEPEPKETR